MISETLLRPAPTDEILQTVTDIVRDLHQQKGAVAQRVKDIFSSFLKQLKMRGNCAEYDHTLEEDMWNMLKQIEALVQPPSIQNLIQLLETGVSADEDRIMLGAFLSHDLEKLAVSHILELFAFIQPQFMSYEHRRVPVHDIRVLYQPQIEMLQQIQDNALVLIQQGIYPLEFVQNVLRGQLDMAVPTETIRLSELLHSIALAVSVQNFDEEYDIVLGTPDANPNLRNTIFLDIDPDLVIQANPSMLFGILYNILKNAAKANWQKHYDSIDVALKNRYGNKNELAQPLHIIIAAKVSDSSVKITVTDYGSGMSLDTSLQRFKEQLKHRLLHTEAALLPESEWYRVIAAAVGEDQAQLLLDWPNNSDAILDVLVRTILILQFVSGFKGESWQIRSLSSGTGLWGVWYILKTLGGLVTATNPFAGGAQFEIKLPLHTVLPNPR